jgi:hypothetical protein
MDNGEKSPASLVAPEHWIAPFAASRPAQLKVVRV